MLRLCLHQCVAASRAYRDFWPISSCMLEQCRLSGSNAQESSSNSSSSNAKQLQRNASQAKHVSTLNLQHRHYSSSSSPTTTTTISSSSSPLVGKEPETPLLQSIRNRIKVRGGPLSVAEYMQEVLTNPQAGYYMKRDVFGSKGDFITSPEISQVFGELIGIWCVLVWQLLGKPSQLNLVELGPGRGTLMADLLRGTSAFKPFAEAIQVHFVEVSPYLRQQQWNKLLCRTTSSSTITGSSSGIGIGSGSGEASQGSSQQQQQQQQEVSSGISGLNGAQVTWHSSLEAVPNSSPSIYIAHEFLDALPVHQFVKDPRRGWLEVMVDTAEEFSADNGDSIGSSSSSSMTAEKIPLVQNSNHHHNQQQQQQQQGESVQSDSSLHLRHVLSPKLTPAGQLLVPRRLAALQQQQQRQQQQQQYGKEEPVAIEIGAHAMAVCETLARRIASAGGAALLIDYGKNGPYENSLTAIRGHEGVHPLSQPGTADLSAWVDFSAMRLAAEQALELEQMTAAAAARSRTSRRPSSSESPLAAAAAAAGEAGPHDAADVGKPSERDAREGVDVYGPVCQADFLHALGIQPRLQALAEGASPAQVESLLAGYHRLVDKGPGGMGAAYLALAIIQRGLQDVPVPFE